MQSRFEQARINQLISSYAPNDPPRLVLDFGDMLSLVWRLDKSAGPVSYTHLTLPTNREV